MAETSFRIASAGPGDAPLLFRFIRELAEYERLSHEVRATEEGLREALGGPRPAVEAVIAHAGGDPVGFALFFHNFSTFAGHQGLYLEDIYIRPEWRGRGFGRRLLVHLARVARERGCPRMEWAALDWNTGAIGFYLGLGAKAMGDWTVYRLTGEALERLASEDPDAGGD